MKKGNGNKYPKEQPFAADMDFRFIHLDLSMLTHPLQGYDPSLVH